MKKIISRPITKIAEKIHPSPSPAKLFIPDWYKKMNLEIDKNYAHRLPNNDVNLTMKSCIPVLDAMSSGYILSLPNDIEVIPLEKVDEYNGLRFMWDVSWISISNHFVEQIGSMSTPVGYSEGPYKWETYWALETPPGYSLLYTHPFYRYDLPFVTMTGLVDSDTFNRAVNLPFFLKDNFSGILEKGTPIAQVIPIKRESWEIKNVEAMQDDFSLDELRSVIKRSYKRVFWKKKNYS